MTGTARRRGAFSLTGARAPATLQTHTSEQARSRRRDGPAPDQDLRVGRRPVWETGAMTGPRLTKIGLTRFKAFTDQELPISALTLLIGRNGSGKSNALDVLSLLALLADGRDLADLEEHGHNAVHVRNRDLAGHLDSDVLDAARYENRVLVSADTDFGEILANQAAAMPSLILFR